MDSKEVVSSAANTLVKRLVVCATLAAPMPFGLGEPRAFWARMEV